MSNFSHLLSKHGVMSSFNIARKIKTKDINKIKNNIIEESDSEPDILNKLNKLILLKQESRSVGDIPGLIIDREKSDMMIYFEGLPPHVKKTLVQISNYFAEKSVEKKLHTPEILVAIQLIFNQLGIETQDLRDFNKMFNDRPPQDDIDEEDDEDEDDEF
jgi:hypothetical protein